MGRSVLPVVLLALASTHCEETSGFTDGRSRLSAGTAVVDFGRVFVGAEKIATLNLIASGDIPVSYSASFEGDAEGFLLTPASDQIGANTAREISVLFRPSSVGSRRVVVAFASDATDSGTVAVTLLGNGVPVPDCEDGNGCTSDSFDLQLGRCVHRSESFPCEDFSACTTNDVCVDEVCLGESVPCDDQDTCTDDFCDAQAGCVHRLAKNCDDANPCTRDICTAEDGCRHEDLDDGTPCDDSLPCTHSDICIRGFCIGVNVDDGTVCDDLDPCSKNEVCNSGACRDPNYEPKGPGDIKFDTFVGELAADGSMNPLVDRDGTTWIGTHYGVAGVDRCGLLVGTATIGEPRWQGALMKPGALVVPIGRRLVEISVPDLRVLRDLDMALAFTSSTATALVFDVAGRSGGSILVSVARSIPKTEGVIVEIDGNGAMSTFAPTGPYVARRLAIDRDESVLALLEATDEADQLVRFGVTESSESWSALGSSRNTEWAMRGEDVLWTHGMSQLSPEGELSRLRDTDDSPAALSVGTQQVAVVSSNGLRLEAIGSTGWAVDVPSIVSGIPAIDAFENTFVVLHSGDILGFSSNGTPVLTATAAPPRARERVSPTLTSDLLLVFGARDRVVGVQWIASISSATWPRFKRDNLGTSHR